MALYSHHVPQLTILLLFSISPFFFTKAQNNIVTDVKVGVILDTSSLDGFISWSCMKMALEDFYASNWNYATRVSLVLWDLKNNHLGRRDNDADYGDDDDVFGAAVAAVDLLKNHRVEAIIGPQTTNQAKLLIELGKKSNVPIISFSAKFPYMSLSQTPYFFRTSWNDSSQATVIASIVHHFKWKEVVPVFEDNTSSNMFVPYLVDTLQEIDAYVPYRCKIPSMASKNEINTALDYMKTNRTRVFVVHMSKKLALKFFSSAKEKNMQTDEFVWITTYGLTDIVDLLGSDAGNVMQGVLGVRPSVPKNTQQYQSVSMRLRITYNVKSGPTVFSLWAYDTVQLLAESIENVKNANLSFKASDALYNSTDFSKIGVSEMGPSLRASIESTSLNGTSGDFKLVNGQLQSGPFEITIVTNRGNILVGNWTGGNLSIDWPGNNKTIPKGWQWPVPGETLVIGIPVKSGIFKEFVKNDTNVTHRFSGYSIKVFEAAINKLPYNVSYKFELYADPVSGKAQGDYNALVHQVYLKKYDAAVGDITILANRSLYVDFTLPYTESGVRLLVPIKDMNKKSPWAFLEPLTPKLWVTTGAFFLLTGITVWFTEHRVNMEFRGGRTNQMGSIFYFAFSTLVFAHKERLVSNLSRVVVVTWIFVVLILQQSYTASLASKLTVEQLQTSVTNIDQVIKAGQYVGYLNNSFMPDLLKLLGVNESKTIPLASADDYNEALYSGKVAAIVHEVPYLKVFLKKYPKNYTMVGPTYKTGGFGFAFPKGSPIVADMSRAILNVTEGPDMPELDRELYGSSTNTDIETRTSASLAFRSFMGLFLLTGATSIIALIIHMSSSIYRRCNSSVNTEAAQSSLDGNVQTDEDQSNGRTMIDVYSFGDNVETDVTSPNSESGIEESISEGSPAGEIVNNETEIPYVEMLA